MDITALEYFKIIAESGSLTKAAQQLHITQPAMSAMLKKLEEELGVELFDRSPNRIHLNKAGEVALVLPGMAYRPLAVSEKGMLFYLLSQGTQEVGYASQAGTEEELLTGGTAGSAYILSSGDGLLVYDGDLYLVGAGGAPRTAIALGQG